MDCGAVVEVQTEKLSWIWYLACVSDVNLDEECIIVDFQDCDWPKLEVDAAQVRLTPGTPVEKLVVEVGDSVEVLKSASCSRPSCWSLAVVHVIRGGFLFCSQVGYGRSDDLIVRMNEVRKPSVEPVLHARQLCRTIMKVGADLTEWISSEDALGCFAHVQSCAALLIATTMKSSEGNVFILLIGTEDNVKLGKQLLSCVHLKNQALLEEARVQIEEYEAKAEEMEMSLGGVEASFGVEETELGRVIGKNGRNLARLQESLEVTINIRRACVRGKPSQRLVHVRGHTQEAVERARQHIEYIKVEFPLNTEQVAWILGDGFEIIQGICRQVKLTYLRFNRDTLALEVCGLPDAVKIAGMTIDETMKHHS